MRVRALPKFEGLLDLERTELEKKEVYPKTGDEWETSKERAEFLKENGVVEIVEDKKAKKEDTKEEVEYLSEPEVKEEKPKENKNKKNSKK